MHILVGGKGNRREQSMYKHTSIIVRVSAQSCETHCFCLSKELNILIFECETLVSPE